MLTTLGIACQFHRCCFAKSKPNFTVSETGDMETEPLNKLYDRLQSLKGCNSIAKKHLTPTVVSMYKDLKTKAGGTLAMCVNTNAFNPGALLPRCADIECYDLFSEYFDAVIRDYHKVTTPLIQHPASNFGNLDKLPFCHVDPTGKYVVSTRVRVGRTVKGFAFAPAITKEDRIKLEDQIAMALKSLNGEHEGTYYPLTGMSKSVSNQLIKDHFLFRDDDSVLRDAGGYRDWPSGRGIFHNVEKSFLVWVNEEDHIRIISMQMGGDLSSVYKRLISGIQKLEAQLSFARHERFGYLTFCPSNLGTTMRASVHLRIPFLSELPNFKDICEKYSLQARGTGGEHTKSIGGVYDISNKRRLGLTEIQAATEMAEGVSELIRIESGLAQNNTTDSLKNGLMPVEPLEMLAEMLWSNNECNSYTKRHLTKALVNKYKGIKTKLGSTLAHCIRTGAYNGRAMLPRMGDPECYDVFSEYVDAIIKDYHQINSSEVRHPPANFGNLDNLPFGDLDPTGRFVVSTRVRVGRSVEGFNFPPTMTKDQRLKLEKTISDALKGLRGEHSGKYYPLLGMNEATQRQLIDDHFLFKDDDPVLRDAGGYRDWPSGRGIFHNDQKTFLVWVCEEDHMRIISMQKGGNLPQIYKRLAAGVNAIESKMQFSRHPKYGFLTFCPSNLGTTMRASVHIKIPKLSADKKQFQEVCDRYNLQARGFHGEHTESPDGIYDLSNKRRVGYAEIDAATEMARGVEEIIKIESRL